MAKNSVTFSVRINDDGTYDLVTKKASKLRQEMEKTANVTEKSTNKRNLYNRQEKGVAQNTSNSTKAFAKQAQTIGGGLVPAYATLAANVFAASAAFGALRSAAALEQLEAGLVAVGAAAGRNLPYLADQLVEITNGAVSAESALQSTALASSAGFSGEQLVQLTKVAKGASLALGRDMEDALNRLVRGTAKLEPEILDELGIMVRLDDAVQAYGEQLGKQASQLTEFERRQAFLNATIEQGSKKFGEIAEAIDPNPYDQLASTFRNLTKEVLTVVNVALTPLANLFSESKTALLGGTILFGSTIARQMLPAMNNMAEAAYEASEALADEALKTKDLDKAKRLSYLSTIRGNQADAIAAASKLKLVESLKFIRVAYINAASAGVSAASSGGVVSGVFNTVKASAMAAATGVRALGAAFLRFMPYLGVLIGLVGLLQPYFEKLFGRGRLEKETDEVVDSFSSFATTNGSLSAALAKTTDQAEQYAMKARAAAGITNQVYSAFERLSRVETDTKLEALAEAQQELKDAEEVQFRMRSSIFADHAALEEKVAKAKEKVARAEENVLALNEKAAKATLENAIKRIEAQGDLSKAMQVEVSGYKALLSEIASGNLTNEDFAARLQAIMINATGIDSAIQSAASSFSLFNQEVIRLANKEVGPFDNLVRQAEGIETTLNSLKDPLGKEAFLKQLGGVFSGKTADEVLAFIDNIKTVNSTLASTKAVQDILAVTAKRLAEASKEDATALDKRLGVENAIVLTKLNALDAEYELAKELNGGEVTEARRLRYIAERGDLTAQLLTDEQISLQVAAKRVEVEGKLLAIQNKITSEGNKRRNALIEMTRLQAQEKAASGPRPRDSLNAAEELKLLKDTRSLRESNISREFKMREDNAIQAFNQEKSRLEKVEGYTEAQRKVEIERARQLKRETINALDEEKKVAEKRLDIEERIAKLKASQAAVTAAGQGDTTADRIFNFGDAGGFDVIQLGQDKVKALSMLVSPMIEDLKKLGPDGELVAAVAQGGLMISESWAKVGDTFANSTNKMEKVSAVAGAIANTLSSVASIASAASNARVAGIDAEIEAEKKRDGKSAQSLAKLQQLEARKDKEKRKAFEVNKKLMLAQAVMSTAAGVAGALAQTGPLGPFAIPLAAMIAAMGAAQIAIISGTSYQSSSSSVSAAAPSQVSLGQRQSSVDLARSSSAAGEISYMRGEQGVGSSASSFRPAFTGMKYRASGGAVAGYMVGEQGPEMFVPDVPGRIVPADETGRGGGTSNVNFTINAVDAAGIEEVLVGQRGNIIGMLREAANAHGQEFLEAVDVSVYTAPNRRTV